MRLFVVGVILVVMMGAVHAGTVSDYNVVWDSPSRDANGTMPLGNGDIGANVWVDPNGDICFYISKTDAWSDNARLLKVGKVRVTCDPPIFKPGAAFKQTLDLQAGRILVESQVSDSQFKVSVSVDANHPTIDVIHESSLPVKMTARVELWRTQQTTLKSLQCSDVMMRRGRPGNMHAPTIIEPDTVIRNLKHSVGWYHHNIKSVGPAEHARVQGVTGFTREEPLLHRTFGAVVTGRDAVRVDDTTLSTASSRQGHISVHVLTQHPGTPEGWVRDAVKLAKQTDRISLKSRRAAHEAWWQAFWNRSWIHVTQGEPVARRVIPESKHAVKVGIDQGGGNRFAGEVGRVSILSQTLVEGVIAELAGGGRSERVAQDGLVGSWLDVASGTALPQVTQADLGGAVTIEAWIKPGNGAGRIVDMITPGGSDGFLLDTHPGKSLRFIVGEQVISKKDCLKEGEWQHVAAVVDAETSSLRLYLNGEQIAGGDSGDGDDAALVARSYALQRFIDACAGRGSYPIKFNGSIFTAPHDGDPDFRRWGPGYWWQNTRLPYLSMCAAGDFDLMQPLFRMYVDEVLPLNIYRTRHYFDHGGAYYAECIHFWGDVFNESYGWTPMEEREDPLQESGWHKWEWVAGPELAFMAMDYYDYTQDEAFLKEKVIPLTIEVLKYFDEHYKTDDKGELVMHPAMACETWWDCTNPMPELAGLHAMTARLLALNEQQLVKGYRTFCEQLQKKLPPLPLRDVDGGKALAPAGRFENKRNCENPELYAVFPFRLCSFEKGNHELGVQALKHRWNRGAFGWRQDDIFMAYLGLADEARSFLVKRCLNSHKDSRFKAFWGPNYDWVPDQDHGGVLMKTLQAMVLQPDPYSRKIYVAPAWPKEWNCEFKLRAPYQTTIEGKVKGGKVLELKVTPESRRGDVVVVEP